LQPGLRITKNFSNEGSFLDRDGVINRHPGEGKYLASLKKLKLLAGAKKAIADLNKAGYKVFIVSNQAGVAKGIYSARTLRDITSAMLKRIESSGGGIDRVFYCLHRKEDACPCRKPKAGLLKKAKRIFPSIKMRDSFFIGDSIRDIRTARSGGCQSILVLTGEEKISNRLNWKPKPDFVFKDLKAAAEFILSRK